MVNGNNVQNRPMYLFHTAMELTVSEQEAWGYLFYNLPKMHTGLIQPRRQFKHRQRQDRFQKIQTTAQAQFLLQ